MLNIWIASNFTITNPTRLIDFYLNICLHFRLFPQDTCVRVQLMEWKIQSFFLLTILIHITKLFSQGGSISSSISTYFISFQHVLLLVPFKIFTNLIDENYMYGQFWLSFLLLVRLTGFHIFIVFSIISISSCINCLLPVFF